MKYVTTMMAMVVFMVGAAHAQVITNNLVGYWQFDGDLTDTTGNNHMGVGGGTLDYVAGQIGNALNLDSAEYAITAANIINTVYGANARTMNVWFNDDVGGTEAFVSYGRGGQADLFEMILYSPGTTWGGHFWGGGVYETALSGVVPAIVVGQWHMATLVYDGVNISVYSDGALVGGYGLALNTCGLGGTQLYAGSSSSTANADYDGQLDDLALWDRVLTGPEIQSIYDAGVAGNDIYSLLSSGAPGTLIYGK